MKSRWPVIEGKTEAEVITALEAGMTLEFRNSLGHLVGALHRQTSITNPNWQEAFLELYDMLITVHPGARLSLLNIEPGDSISYQGDRVKAKCEKPS